MDSASRPTYRKHNSFLELRHGTGDRQAQARTRLATLRLDPARAAGLSVAHAQILERAFADLFDEPADETPRFALSPHVVEEVATLDDDQLSRYVLHRYRYEMFPQRRQLDDYPPYLQIEPSSTCNFRCVFCFETDPTFTDKASGFMGRMTLDLFKQVVDEAQGNVEFLSLASRGEPLICPDIVPMLEYTRGKFLNLKINTNASLLDERKAHAILSGSVRTVVFSVDAAEEPLYSKLRVNGKLSVVKQNIERFQHLRATQYRDARVITRVSGVRFSDEQEFDSMQAMWGGLVDQVAFVKYNPWENVYIEPTRAATEPCSDLWRRMFVWWDGKVNPCDVDYKSTLQVGTFPERTLSDVWRSTGYAQLRETHTTGRRGTSEPCNRCTVI